MDEAVESFKQITEVMESNAAKNDSLFLMWEKRIEEMKLNQQTREAKKPE